MQSLTPETPSPDPVSASLATPRGPPPAPLGLQLQVAPPHPSLLNGGRGWHGLRPCSWHPESLPSLSSHPTRLMQPPVSLGSICLAAPPPERLQGPKGLCGPWNKATLEACILFLPASRPRADAEVLGADCQVSVGSPPPSPFHLRGTGSSSRRHQLPRGLVLHCTPPLPQWGRSVNSGEGRRRWQWPCVRD